jgi:hypothetical protein
MAGASPSIGRGKECRMTSFCAKYGSFMIAERS